MKNVHKCRNHAVCGNFVEKSFGLCDECRKEANELSRNTHRVEQEEKNFVDKNEGLRRRKWWQR